jgi:hypothetical protein
MRKLLFIFSIVLVASCAASGGSPSERNSTDGTTPGNPTTGATTQDPLATDARIIYLHHSTGGCIWDGGIPDWVAAYNNANSTSYAITEIAYPSSGGYGWANYPYDYWNIWVNHAGPTAYLTEPTLEMLTADYDVIVFKHCFPVSGIDAGTGSASVSSETKTVENYKLQYEAIKTKMRSFPSKRFIVWTGAALIASATSEAQATRARAFFDWVKDTWDEKGDNIYVWDFWTLETDGGLYLTAEHSSGDSHPSAAFSTEVAPYFCARLVNVIQGKGDTTSLTAK